ncbi:MAG TPA: hypothetical protein VIV58_09260, partial [Kofleriaceae bacterium]
FLPAAEPVPAHKIEDITETCRLTTKPVEKVDLAGARGEDFSEVTPLPQPPRTDAETAGEAHEPVAADRVG